MLLQRQSTGLLAVLVGSLLSGSASAHESPLRASQPIETIAADLEDFVPRYMEEQKVPGVSIALIRDWRIAWRKGLGVSNTVTRDVITPDTVFEVASNSPDELKLWLSQDLQKRYHKLKQGEESVVR